MDDLNYFFWEAMCDEAEFICTQQFSLMYIDGAWEEFCDAYCMGNEL